MVFAEHALRGFLLNVKPVFIKCGVDEIALFLRYIYLNKKLVLILFNLIKS